MGGCTGGTCPTAPQPKDKRNTLSRVATALAVAYKEKRDRDKAALRSAYRPKKHPEYLWKKALRHMPGKKLRKIQYAPKGSKLRPEGMRVPGIYIYFLVTAKFEQRFDELIQDLRIRWHDKIPQGRGGKTSLYMMDQKWRLAVLQEAEARGIEVEEV